MRRFAPVLTLVLLSPFIAEILLGATPLSRVASLPPLIMLYGGGSLLIRELARRNGLGWCSIAWLAAAYALIEEGLVMQTIFSPDLFNAAACGGRAFGVNWVWTEALMGYHIVWSIIIPIAAVEIAFPTRRAEKWLGQTGITVAFACYTFGAVAIAVTFRRLITPNFRAPAPLLVFTGVIAAMVITGALRLPRPPTQSSGTPAAPGLVGLTTFFAAVLWLRLLDLPLWLRNGVMVLVPMFLEGCMVWAFLAFMRRRRWTDLHALAMMAGAMSASAIYGVTVIKDGSVFDRTAQALCSAIALLSLGALAYRVHSSSKIERLNHGLTGIEAHR